MVGLSLYQFVDIHGAGEGHHGQDRKAHRQLVAHHLGTRAEGADEGKLVVRRPSGQDAEHSDRRAGDEEEDAHIEVDDLQTVAPRQHCEAEERGDDHQIGSQGEEKFIDMFQLDKLLDKHLHGVGHTLEQAPGTYAVRAETALEVSADLTLVEYVEKRQDGVEQQQPHAYKHTFQCGGQPARHATVEQVVEPRCKRVEIVYRVIIHNVIFGRRIFSVVSV